MYSVCDTPKGGFPHSDTSGSKLICQLPEAFRRLSRPSSPIIAKASTTCSYSLDPITLTSHTTRRPHKTSSSRNVSGLSPDALLPYSTRFETQISIEFFALTQSKVADGTVHRSAFRRQLIRLYEFLKNSLLIDQYRSTTTKPQRSYFVVECNGGG